MGALAGGVSIALAFWLLGGLLRWWPLELRLLVLGLGGLLAIARDLRVISFSLPENRRLVPRTLFYRGHRRAALQFGFELGTGVRTYLPASGPYVLALAAALASDALAVPILIGAGFGAGRAIMTWSRYFSRHVADAWDARLRADSRWIVRVGTVASSMVVVGLSGLPVFLQPG
jgi:hypothetical protein